MVSQTRAWEELAVLEMHEMTKMHENYALFDSAYDSGAIIRLVIETRNEVLAAMKLDHSKLSPFLRLPPTELIWSVFPSRFRGTQSLIIIT